MLQILRDKAQSTVIQAIVVIIALVFIFWGVGSNLMNNREAALTVNGEEISFQDFQQAYDRAYQNMADQFGGNLPKGLAESLNIKQQVINQLVQTALLRQGAREMGIIVSSDEIQATINNMVQFQENGAFSIDKYKNLLASNRLSPNKFESNMRYDMLAEKTVRDIGGFAAISSEDELKELYRQANEKVSVKYTSLTATDFSADVTIDDNELAKWFADNSDQYKTEPQVKLQYLPFTYADVGEKITIDDTLVGEYYSENTSQFSTEEQRRARHILFKAGENDSEQLHEKKKQLAAEVATMAKSGTDFATLAAEYSEGPTKDNGGDLGFFSRGQMVPSFEEAVFGMQPGEVSEVVQSPFGYHLIQLEDIEPAQTTPLAEVSDEIRTILRYKEAQPLAFQLANTAYEGIIGGGSMQAYLETSPDSKAVVTDFFSRSNAPEQLAGDLEFMNTAFSLKAGELSSLVKTEKGCFVLFAQEVKDPQTPELADVRDQVEKDFAAARGIELASEAAQELLAKLASGTSIEDAAAEYGLQISDSGLIGRNGQGESSFPPSLAESVFRLSPAEPFPAEPGIVGEDYYVYSFVDREIPEEITEEELAPYRQVLLRNKQQEVLSAYLANLENEAVITRHKSL